MQSVTKNSNTKHPCIYKPTKIHNEESYKLVEKMEDLILKSRISCKSCAMIAVFSSIKMTTP